MNQSKEMVDREACEVRAALERELSEHFGRRVCVSRCEQRPFSYRTSFDLAEIEAELDDGTRLALLLKDLSRAGLQGAALQVKPGFLYDPCREIEVYRQVLSDRELGTPRCYGAVVEADIDRYWLFLERVRGRGLYQIGDLVLWQEAARWLARMHCRFANEVDELADKAPLVHYDADFYRVWMERAKEFLPDAALRRGAAQWERLVDGYEGIIARLRALPTTFIHGEFYASNVLIEEPGRNSSSSTGSDRICPEGSGTDGVRVCSVDWETAAVGPGLIDVAALTAGKWSDKDRTAVVEAYWSQLHQCGAERMPLSRLLTELDYCRLHLAVQWLGWSPNWTPPARHTHDWLAEAMELSEKLVGTG